MISLEGLTLSTHRYREAGYILRTFAHYVRDGLIPNMFPDGQREGLYHTADATLWFFHAIERYTVATGDAETLRKLLPVLVDIVAASPAGHALRHRRRSGRRPVHAGGARATSSRGWTRRSTTGSSRRAAARRSRSTRSGTTRCACCRRWTRAVRRRRGLEPRRSRARARASRSTGASGTRRPATSTTSSTARTATIRPCRPNQVFAISLPHPVLDRERWEPVMKVVRERLLTPVGLRSLAPGEPDYKARYYGDLRARDAAYHQGTVWAWLIGPYVDAGLKLPEADRSRAARPARRLRSGHSTRRASARSARSSTPRRRTCRAAASRRPGASPKCCAAG